MVLVAILGKLGSGKTLLLTKLGYMAYNEGKKVYADYHLKFDYTYINNLFDITKIENTDDKIFLFDEIWVSADAREFMSKQNIEISRFILQSRKKNFNVISTAQHLDLIERRIRLVNDVILLPKILSRVDNNNLKSKPTQLLVEKYMKDILGNYRFINKIIYDVYDICDLYDTTEVIKPMNVQKVYAEDFKKKYDKIIKKYVNDKRKLTKNELKTLLILDENINHSDVDMLCDYIRVKKKSLK